MEMEEVEQGPSSSSYSSMDMEDIVESRTSSSAVPQGSSFIHEYDVFVSFRGTDVRNSFASFVVQELEAAGMKTFFDETKLDEGDPIPSILEKAEASEMFVIIFSKDYADSEFCLKEAAIAFKSGRKIFPIFYHVKPSDVKHQEGIFGKGFRRLTDKVESEELIEDWKATLKHAAKIKGFEVDQNTKETEVIKKLVTQIQSKLKHVNIWRLPEYQVGLDSHVTEVRQLLSLEDNSKVLMVVISGGIGFGKTTIAKATYNKIWRSFDSCSFLKGIAKGTSNATSKKDELLDHYENSKSIGKGKVLIVLEDVDNDQQLRCLGMTNHLNDLTPGSRVIITTRIQNPELWRQAIGSEGLKYYEVRELNDVESLKLFCCHVFGTEEPRKGYEKKCKDAISMIESSPLAIELTAPYFRDVIDKPLLWEKILEDDNFLSKDLEDLLSISYDGLTREAQCVFIDVACFLIGMEQNVAASILEDWRQYPLRAIGDMKRASLLKHNANNSLEMQSIVRNLGMTLARREKNDPVERRRLWDHDDVERVLQNLSVRASVLIDLYLLYIQFLRCLLEYSSSN